MKIKSFQKIIKQRNFNKKLFFIIGFISYTIFISIIILKKDSIYSSIREKIPLSSRQKIKESLPYQIYKSKFRINFPLNYLNGFKERVSPIRLDIKFKDINKLNLKRAEALKIGFLIKSNEDYVNAVISNGSDIKNAQIRLKGDWTDHLQNDKLSYRVKINDGNSFLGMKKFSLQSPVTRNYLWEWKYHTLLKDEGLPALRYKFRPLIINGNYLGIYAIEEHFDKTMLEANKFKESPIVKFSEDIFWQNKVNNNEIDSNEEFEKTFSSPFQLNKIKRSKIQMNYLESANSILNGFKEGKLSTSEAFDIQALANFFAISDLLNAHHGTKWHNMRFYFDPVISKLIPIGFDGIANKYELSELLINRQNHKWINLIFSDKEFTKEYITALSKVSKEKYLKNFYKRNKKQYLRNKNILYKSYPALDNKEKSIIKNQIFISKLINPISPLNIYMNSIDDKHLIIKVANNQIFPLELINIKIDNLSVSFNPSQTILNSRNLSNNPIYKNIKIPVNKKFLQTFAQKNELSVTYKILGKNEIRTKDVNLFPRNDLDLNEKDELLVLQKTNLKNLDYLVIDEKNKLFTFKNGLVNINKPIFIPEGYKVKAYPGTKIKLKNNAHIISKSPLSLIGNKSSPIVIEGDENFKGGIAVIDTSEVSKIEHVKFKNLGSIQETYLNIPGSITFYQAPVDIEYCYFENSNSEDSLNIVRSNFKIKNSFFDNSQSDAIDIDFSDGIIKNLKIENSLNDGLDLSGSTVDAANLKIINSGDKGISLGEESFFKGDNIFINQSYVGIANKDGSNSSIKNIYINKSEYGLAIFNKKAEYGKAMLTLKNLKLNEISEKYLLSDGQILIVDKFKINPNLDNNLIYKKIYK